jgi:prepilin-type N-terminal cleavage/methylation domain-containing protein
MKNKGFTLIELLVVVAIMGILVTMGAMSFTGMISRARIRGSADKITQEIQGARERAMSRGHAIDVTFSFSPGGGCQMSEVYHTPNGDVPVGISPFNDCRLGIITGLATPAPSLTNAPPDSGIDFPAKTIRFLPQGVGTTGAVYIKSINGKIQYAISVNANGRVEKWLWSGTAWN